MAEIRTATEADRSEVCALIDEMMPGIDVAARWRWMYETNPGGRAITWLAVEDGKVAGCTSFFPFRMWLDGEMRLGALGGDGYVRPAFRRRGLGGLLHDTARRDMSAHRIGCMYGAPGAMNVTPLKHGGSRQVGTVSRWARPLWLPKPRFVGHLDPIAPMDARVDALWEGAKATIRLGAIRDAKFYTWRFLAAPAKKQKAFVILDRSGTPIGACALQQMGETLHIVDLLSTDWTSSLRAIARYANETTDAKVLDIKLFTLDGRKKTLWRAGFVERNAKPFLCVVPAEGGDRRFVDPDRWFYCGGDSDLDEL